VGSYNINHVYKYLASRDSQHANEWNVHDPMFPQMYSK